MKKTLSFLLVIALATLFCSTFSYSEELKVIDFENLSSLTAEELLSCDKQIEEEKAKRGLSTSLPDGNYIVGKDIAPGDYVIKYFGFTDNYQVDIIIYADETMDWDHRILTQPYRNNGEAKLHLEEGQVLSVEYGHKNGAIIIEKADPLFMY